MTVAISKLLVTVNDPDIALAFYHDGLGLEIIEEIHEGGTRRIILAVDGQSVDVVLSSQPDGRPQNDGRPIIFRTGNLGATVDRLVATGADLLERPSHRSWGVMDCSFLDPSGNLVRIEQA